MKSGKLGRVVPIAAAMALLVMPALQAQQSSGQQVSYPAFLFYRSEIKPGGLADYIKGVTNIVAAAKKSQNAPRFATFSAISGPQVYYTFLPLRKMGDMDTWDPLPEMLTKALGMQGMQQTMMSLGKGSAGSSKLVTYEPEMGNPPNTPMTTPPPTLYHVSIRVKPEAMLDFMTAVQKITSAARKNPKALHTIVYSNMVGGHGPEFDVFAGLQNLSDFDSAPSVPDMLIAAYGQQQGMQILNDLSKAASIEREFLKLVPELSNGAQ